MYLERIVIIRYMEASSFKFVRFILCSLASSSIANQTNRTEISRT